MQLIGILTPAEEGGYVAFNPETGTMTQGETIETALANPREAVKLYLEDFPLAFFATSFITTFNVAEQA